MAIRPSNDYSDIPISWFLGDEGDISQWVASIPPTPREFNPQKARLFLQYIQIGMTDRQACLEVPIEKGLVRSWLRGCNASPDNFVNAYGEFAIDQQMDSMADDVVDISDGTDLLAQGHESAEIASIDNPIRRGGNLKRPIELEKALLAKRAGDRMASRKWLVSKRAAKRYGDKLQLDHGNTGGKPFKTLDFGSLTVEQLEALADIDDALNVESTDDK